ncbi:MAG: acyltransferase [Candidatus Sericytochromatia bacterium]|nr:acyltransferase [Candidatus Sericytochromatia bacterium]
MNAPADPPVAPSSPALSHVGVMDGLRGLAVAWVVWFHIWQLSWLPQHLGPISLQHLVETGFSGVELFFFISGFCLFLPWVRARLSGSPAPGLRHYAYRRAIKILPSYWLSLLAMLAIARPDWLTDPAAVAWNLGWHLVFLQNVVDSTQQAINGVTWSLGVEVQFYVLFPLVAAAFVRFPRTTCLALVALAEAWRRGAAAWWPGSLSYAMIQLPAYVDLFAFGMAAAWLIAHRAASPPPTRLARALATLVALGALAWVNGYASGLWDSRIGNSLWPLSWQVQQRGGLGLAFLVLAVASARALPAWQALLAWRPLVWLSLISYNLYLWHQFLGRQLMYTWRWPPAATPDPHQDPAWALPFTLVAYTLALAVAGLITHGLERPLLRHGPRGCLRRLLGH